MNTGKKIAAAFAMLIGAACIIIAWGLLFEGDKSPVIIAVEVGGVAIALAGYIYWQRLKNKSPSKPAEQL
ncbi:MAG TPA: hypothetical protein VN455_12325 [Methanotrichaceae archaeon]|nr:hypothetical protein [Methanotrichaceae archaeon]